MLSLCAQASERLALEQEAAARRRLAELVGVQGGAGLGAGAGQVEGVGGVDAANGVQQVREWCIGAEHTCASMLVAWSS